MIDLRPVRTNGRDRVAHLPDFEGEGGRFRFFPNPDVFPEFLAGTFQPVTGFVGQLYSSIDIETAGNQRPLLALGGSFGFIGSGPAHRGTPWRLNVDGGIRAQFDRKNSQDNLGWDGNYGASFRFAASDRWAFKAGVLHTSAHLGDEFIQKTGRERIGYTREEAVLAAAWTSSAGVTAYLEGGYAYRQGPNEVQEPGRAQAGVQLSQPHSPFGKRIGWFAAADFLTFEERNFDVTTSIVAGITVGSDARTYRFGVEFGSGRPPFGEFWDKDETYVGIGVRGNLGGATRF